MTCKCFTLILLIRLLSHPLKCKSPLAHTLFPSLVWQPALLQILLRVRNPGLLLPGSYSELEHSPRFVLSGWAWPLENRLLEPASCLISHITCSMFLAVDLAAFWKRFHFCLTPMANCLLELQVRIAV